MFFQNLFNWFINLFNRKPEYKRVPVPKKMRIELWNKYNKDNPTGFCYCCGELISKNGWHAAHVIAEVKGGETTLDNLRVTCQHCNLSMGSQNLYCYIVDNKLKGLGSLRYKKYFKQHPDQIGDKRTR